jgi:hypothetical protein
MRPYRQGKAPSSFKRHVIEGDPGVDSGCISNGGPETRVINMPSTNVRVIILDKENVTMLKKNSVRQ